MNNDTSTDPLDILQRIADWPANSNSDPDTMAEALDQIQQLANNALHSLTAQPVTAGSNKELADQLISAASALNHGRHATAIKKVTVVFKALHSETNNPGSRRSLDEHQSIFAGQDQFGPFLMIDNFRSAMPSGKAAHIISHLINDRRSYCGQLNCPCGSVDPPHDS